jgi:quercetin dioxygenase-like cupin family protein
MRTTLFELEEDRVVPQVSEPPPWRPFEEYEGKPLERVRVWDIAESPGGLLQLVEIGAGGHFAMHSSPDIAFCQVVRGRGRLGLPGGRELAYAGPELFVFFHGTLHDWHAIEEDTLLSVCLVRQTQ